MNAGHDLSLLTDDEREYYTMPNSNGERVLAEALIAARAEIQRKDEALAFYAANENWLCSGDPNFGDLITNDDLERNSPITKREFVGGKRARAALLQSEKERCPVHGFEMPCMGCEYSALIVGVDEQEKSEKGGE